jgi:hypothetical protein
MIQHALEVERIDQPSKHLIVMQAASVGTFLFSRTAFSQADILALQNIAQTRGFQQRWPAEDGSAKASTVASVLESGTGPYAEKGIDLRPPTDDRPFFFQTISVFKGISDDTLNKLSNNEHSVASLRFLFWTVGALTLVLFFAPFVVERAIRRRAAEFSPRLWTGSGYFLCIGLAFMLVEMPWLQRFVLYLGHPSYATTVVLTSLLFGAGCGAIAATGVNLKILARWGLALPAAVLLANLTWTPMFHSTLGWGFAARAALSALTLVPAGFLMGFAFPSGMRSFGDAHIPWFWAVNGAAGVLASIFALMFAIAFGFHSTVLVGAGFYVLAWVLLRFAVRTQLHDPEFVVFD